MKRIAFLFIAMLSVCSCGIYKARMESNAAMLTAEQINLQYSPDGTVTELYHKCSVPGPSARRLLVYLPKGYYDNEDRYPVFYLIHGARGNETAWIVKGDVLHCADSLFANGKARPCIIVFPNLNHYVDDRDYGNSRSLGAMEAFYETDGRAESAFVRDVVPVVDSCFRTIPDKEHRAIGGMSIGALQSIYISAWNPDCFDYIGMFSPMYKAPPRHGKYAWFYGSLKENQKVQFADAPVIYDIEIGRADFFYPHIRNYRKYLDSCGYPFQYYEYPGGHEWYNWRKALINFLQMFDCGEDQLTE